MGYVQVDYTERVAWLTLQRPPLNVLNIAMMRELSAAIEEIAANPTATIVALGADTECRAFCAGVDIPEHRQYEEMLATFHGVIRNLLALDRTTVALIEGPALGGGLELALACDMLLARETSTLGFPEIKLACFPPVALAVLPTLCGRAVTSDLILTGDSVGAHHAMQLGLVSRVFPDDNFSEGARDVLTGLSERSPEVLRLTTRAVRTATTAGVLEALAKAEDLYTNELGPLPDMREGIDAFVEKRRPKWAV